MLAKVPGVHASAQTLEERKVATPFEFLPHERATSGEAQVMAPSLHCEHSAVASERAAKDQSSERDK